MAAENRKVSLSNDRKQKVSGPINVQSLLKPANIKTELERC